MSLIDNDFKHKRTIVDSRFGSFGASEAQQIVSTYALGVLRDVPRLQRFYGFAPPAPDISHLPAVAQGNMYEDILHKHLCRKAKAAGVVEPLSNPSYAGWIKHIGATPDVVYKLEDKVLVCEVKHKAKPAPMTEVVTQYFSQLMMQYLCCSHHEEKPVEMILLSNAETGFFYDLKCQYPDDYPVPYTKYPVNVTPDMAEQYKGEIEKGIKFVTSESTQRKVQDLALNAMPAVKRQRVFGIVEELVKSMDSTDVLWLDLYEMLVEYGIRRLITEDKSVYVHEKKVCDGIEVAQLNERLLWQ